MTQERGKLEPCPFCGGNASRHDLTEEGNEGGSCIACDQCGASSPVHFDRKENLYDSWNRRSTSAAERGMREAQVPTPHVDVMRNYIIRLTKYYVDAPGWFELAEEARGYVAALSGIEGEDEQARD